jgi:hypothetical protein
VARSVCENCATPDDELIAVQRVYVTPEAWDSPEASAKVVDEVEHWCVSCCTQYPHILEGEAGEGAAPSSD